MTVFRRSFVLLLCAMALLAAVAVWQNSSRRPLPPALQVTEPRIGHRPGEFNPEIRVRLTAADQSLRCDGPFSIVLPGSPRVLHRGESLKSSPLSATPNGIAIGDVKLPATRIEVVPRDSPALWLGGHQYRGRLRISRMRDGSLLAVNVLPLEEYLASVIDSEMPIAFGVEARRVQAIAGRTYALYQMQQNRSHPYFDLFDSERSQKYLGVKYHNREQKLWAGESADSRSVVADTQGIVCTHNGRLFCTYFSAACGGRTTLGTDLFSDAAPPLQSIACNWCRESDRYRWTQTIPMANLREQLQRVGTLNRATTTTISQVRDATGDLLTSRPTDTLTLSDGMNSWRITHDALRTASPAGTFPSSLFRAELQGDKLVVSGRGHGHGVGLCQWGAKGQSSAGRTAPEILQSYYPGSRLVRLTTTR